ncbi:MAG: CHAT domain-containing protein, partial [Bacteroidetes bacterium]
YSQKKEADSLWKNSNYLQAIQKLENAIAIYKNTTQWDNWIICNQQIADYYIDLSQYDSVKTKLDIVKDAILPNNILKIKQKVLEGKLVLQEGMPDVAQRYFEDALKNYETKFSKNLKEKAEVLNLLGVCFWNLGQKEKALDHYNQTLKIRKEIYGNEHEIVAGTYNDIGLLYANDDLEKAAEYYQKAIDIYEKKLGITHPKVANLYNNLALLYQKQHNLAKSEIFLQKVLEIRIKTFGEKHPNVAFVKNSMAFLALEKNQIEKAKELSNEALNIYKEKYGEKHPELANTYRILATIERQNNQFDKALAQFQKALIANSKAFNSMNIYQNPDVFDYYNPDIQLNTLLLKAQTLKDKYSSKTLKYKELKNALFTLQAADSLIDQIRQTRKNKEDKIALGKISTEIYEESIATSLLLTEVSLNKKKYRRLAFYFAEKSKASVLLSALSETSAKQFAGIPDELLEKEKKINDELTQTEQMLAQKPAIEIEQKLAENLFALRGKQDEFIKNLEAKFPEYYKLKYQNQPVSIPELQEKLPENTAILSYFEGEKTNILFVFYVSKKVYKVKEVKIDSNFVRSMRALRNGIEYKAKITYSKYAHKLYKILFPFSTPAEKLILIPDGRLGSVPFEVLLTKPAKEETLYKEMDFLVRKKAISYAYSATLALQTYQKKNAQAHGGFLLAPVNFEREELASLSATLQEIQRIESLFKQNNILSKSYLYENASEEQVKSKELFNYRYIHLATHGFVDEENPQLSQIFLSPTDTKQDGNLYAGEIYNLRCNADLISLSACQTGLGKISKGEGIIGLTRALLYAGAKNISVSLWSVSDQSTAELMQYFYEEFLGNEINSEGYAKALQKAKLRLFSNPEWCEPYFWGAFVLVGF